MVSEGGCRVRRGVDDVTSAQRRHEPVDEAVEGVDAVS